MRLLIFFIGIVIVLNSCKPEDRNKGLVCEMPSDKLKLVLNDIFIYEATKNSKSLDSLSLSYSKTDVYAFVYKKYDTSRLEVQEAIECFTAKKTLVPILKELETSYKKWRENPQFQFDESNDSLQ